MFSPIGRRLGWRRWKCAINMGDVRPGIHLYRDEVEGGVGRLVLRAPMPGN